MENLLMEPYPDITQLKIAKIVQCSGHKKIHSSLKDFTTAWKQTNNSGGFYYREVQPTTDQLYTFAMNRIKESREADLTVHNANVHGLYANKIIAKNVLQLMQQIGMSETFRERDLKSRARIPKYNNRMAGYITDIQREIIRDDGYETNMKKYDECEKYYKDQLDNFLAEEVVKKNKNDKEEQKKKDERKAILEIATLILRYSLPEDSDWSDIYEALLKKDKYLDLASAMLSVRNNWNDGSDRVESALGRFKVETDEDKEIDSCIGNLLTNWDNEGRVFRDCEFGYDYLFSKVESQLYKDYDLVQSRAFPDGDY